jgi:hypothetical protein
MLPLIILDMDCLRKYDGVILCVEKSVRVLTGM